MSKKIVMTQAEEFVELIIKGLKDRGVLKEIKDAMMPELKAALLKLYADIVAVETSPLHGWQKYLRVLTSFVKLIAKQGWRQLRNFAPVLVEVAVAIVFKGKWDWLVDIVFPGLLKAPTQLKTAVPAKAASTKEDE